MVVDGNYIFFVHEINRIDFVDKRKPLVLNKFNFVRIIKISDFR